MLSLPVVAHRKRKLRRLDSLLNDLEELNYFRAPIAPKYLVVELIAEGVPARPTYSITRLMDLVFDEQEKYLRPISEEDRTELPLAS
ncbi:MAG: hypothetical protein ACYDGR_12790 [Candidatus Dormibacteria bacterium]